MSDYCEVCESVALATSSCPATDVIVVRVETANATSSMVAGVTTSTGVSRKWEASCARASRVITRPSRCIVPGRLPTGASLARDRAHWTREARRPRNC